MPYFARIFFTSSNHFFIRFGSSQRALWKSYAREKRVFSSGRRCTKRYAQFLPTRFPPRVVSRRFAISSTPSIRGGNPRESRSRTCRTTVSSSDSVNLCCEWRFSAFATRPVIRLRRELKGTLYVFAARRIDIFLFVRIASMARKIRASSVWIGIVLLCSVVAIGSRGRGVVEK